MAKEEKEKAATRESELSALGSKRAKDLSGLTRRDKDKMHEINMKFREDCEAVNEKYAKLGAEAATKAKDAAAKKKKDDEAKASARAKAKQKKGKK